MHRKGFTIIELLVSIGLFSVVVSLGVGGFTSALRTQRQASSLIAANSNVSLAIEQIMREIRTGSRFCSAGPCGATELTFTNARNETVTYCFRDNAIERGTGGGGCGSLGFQKITADNIRVEHLQFYRSGTNAGDGLQPRITIAIGVSSPEAGVSGGIINLQTTVSSRLPLDT
jgi:prepilin-type N-terminal cleavage/methylation domain-containing protein